MASLEKTTGIWLFEVYVTTHHFKATLHSFVEYISTRLPGIVQIEIDLDSSEESLVFNPPIAERIIFSHDVEQLQKYIFS